MQINANEYINEELLVWSYGAYNRPDRSVGEQCGSFDDFEIDRERTHADVLAKWDSLSSDVQEHIQELAHDKAVEDYLDDPGF